MSSARSQPSRSQSRKKRRTPRTTQQPIVLPSPPPHHPIPPDPHTQHIRRLFRIAPYLLTGIGLSTLSLTHRYTNPMAYPMLTAGFGSTCFVLFFFPSTALATPRHALGGHLLSACMGLLCQAILGDSVWTIPLAVVLACWIMHVTETIHPPAAGTPITIIMQHASINFLITPLALGVLWLVILSEIHKYWRHYLLSSPHKTHHS